MATRQYIGARYVLKVYQNSHDAGSAEWESGVNYEPLTMVTYQNSTYVSRSFVPSSAGNPATATTYWAITGYYNGQIANLQNEIDAINKVLTNEKIICVGDSFATYPTASNGWIARLQTYTGLDNAHFSYVSDGGAGFCNPGNDTGMTFIELFNQLTSSMSVSDLADVTKVIVVGGCNDTKSSYDATFATAVSAMISRIATVCPNASIYMGYNGSYYGDSEYAANVPLKQVRRTEFAYRCGSFNAHKDVYFIPDIDIILQSRYLMTDSIHPNQFGSATIAAHIKEFIYSGGSLTNYLVTYTPTHSYIHMTAGNGKIVLKTDRGAVVYEGDPISISDGINNDLGSVSCAWYPYTVNFSWIIPINVVRLTLADDSTMIITGCQLVVNYLKHATLSVFNSIPSPVSVKKVELLSDGLLEFDGYTLF